MKCIENHQSKIKREKLLFLFNFFLFTRWREREERYLKIKKNGRSFYHTHRERARLGWWRGANGAQDMGSRERKRNAPPSCPFCIFTTHSNGGPHFYMMRPFHSLLVVDNIFFFPFPIRYVISPACCYCSLPFFLSIFFFFLIPPPLFLKSLRGLLDREWGCSRIRNRGNAINPFYILFLFSFCLPLYPFGETKLTGKGRELKKNSFSF